MTQKIGLELDLAWDCDFASFFESLPKPFTVIKVLAIGPGGGNPMFQFECPNIDIARQIYNVYSDNMGDDDDFKVHLFEI